MEFNLRRRKSNALNRSCQAGRLPPDGLGFLTPWRAVIIVKRRTRWVRTALDTRAKADYSEGP
jgi:hypothetical protein